MTKKKREMLTGPVWRGKSGQLWYELNRDAQWVYLWPEYNGGKGTDGSAHTALSLADFERAGFELLNPNGRFPAIPGNVLRAAMEMEKK